MGEPQFASGRVVGDLDMGVFFQRVQRRHIYRVLNAKGMDAGLYRQLRGKCRLWRIEFDDHQVLEIEYKRIELSGKLMQIKGAGKQWMVPLKYFDELTPATQKRLF